MVSGIRHLNLRERALLSRRREGSRGDTGPQGDHWRQVREFRDPEQFARPLETAGVTPAKFEAVLALDEGSDEVGTDNFARHLERLAELRNSRPDWRKTLDRVAPFRAEGLEPFPSLVGPLLAAGYDRVLELCRAAARDAPILAQNVADSAFSHLLGRIARMVQRTLLVELHESREAGMLEGISPKARFAHFCALLREPAYAGRILDKYPVLARQLFVAVEQWEASVTELISRYAQDARNLDGLFGESGARGALSRVALEAGDAHRDGRTVAFLEFESGRRLVYKPRSMAIDVAFAGLLDWMRRRGFKPILRAPACIDRGDYGWAECIARRDCRSPGEIERFYERQGALLGLLHALCGTDFHHENLIACGSDPVPVDLETLMVPQLTRLGLGGGASPAGSEIHDSVLNVGLLPKRIWEGKNGGGVDMSGLGADGEESALVDSLVLEATGTDRMRLVRKPTKVPAGSHLPIFGGRPVSVGEHAAAFMRGLSAAYDFLAAHREALLAPGGPIAAFAAAETRLILRPTYFYALILMDSFHPRFLEDGLDRDLFFERLRLHAPVAEREPQIVEAERQALWRNDIPRFTARADERHIRAPGGELFRDRLPKSPLERVADRLRSLGPEDRPRQLWLAEKSLALLDIRRNSRTVAQHPVRLPLAPQSKQAYLDRAVAVGRRLSRLAWCSADGHVSWMTCYPAGAGDWSYREAGNDLFGGLPGFALFFAYLAEASSERKFEELARGAWKTLCWRLMRPDFDMDGPGAFAGWGGLLYAAADLARLWEDDGLLTEILDRCPAPAALLENDRNFDIVGGAAGFLAVALSLWEDDRADLAASCLVAGDNLLAHAVETEGGGLAWPPSVAGGRPLGGFSHGAAGIAWSLFRLARQSGNERYRAAAERALAYDRSLYSPDENNWRDLRAGPRPGEAQERAENFVVAWCHGAPGIGLSRLLIRASNGSDAALGEDVARARAKTMEDGFGRTHCLCHGDLGNLDILGMMARADADAELARRCDRLAAGILESAADSGWRTGFAPGTEPLGLMTGLAGIGYGLLRYAAPDRVPSVLALGECAEPPARMRR